VEGPVFGKRTAVCFQLGTGSIPVWRYAAMGCIARSQGPGQTRSILAGTTGIPVPVHASLPDQEPFNIRTFLHYWPEAGVKHCLHSNLRVTCARF